MLRRERQILARIGGLRLASDAPFNECRWPASPR